MSTFSKRLKMLRLEKQLTQKQLAVLAGTTERVIQNYELDERKPGFDKLISLADSLNVSIDYLVGRSDDPTRH